jgi:hypothetical protein
VSATAALLAWTVLGVVMCGYGVLAGREAALLWGGLGCVLGGISWVVWAPSGDRWYGVPELVIGLWSLWQWWRRGGGRDRAARAVGAKSRALVDALVRRVREAGHPA